MEHSYRPPRPSRTFTALGAFLLVTIVAIGAAPAPPDATAAGTRTHAFTTPATNVTSTGPPIGAAGGWQSASPASVGMDASVLQGTCDYAMQPKRHTQGVVVIRGGKLVDECYAPGEGPHSWAGSWSVAKSYASTLIGIAIAQGKIPSLNVPMSDYFPEWVGTPKAAITLHDVVTMSSGLQWSEDYNPASAGVSDVIQMGLAADELAYAKSRPLAHTPGTVWHYSSGDAMLLSGVIEQATGMSAGDYAQQVLFEPLGMHQVEWWTDAAGHTLTYCCLDTTSRNFARLGLLFLNHGSWNGHQIVPAQWVDDAFAPVPGSNGQYGYMWWIAHMPEVEGPIYFANGFDGQLIAVIPSLDVVVVRNSDYVKSRCLAVADPNLFGRYPPSGLVPGQGTQPPEDWAMAAFLRPVVQSVTGPSPGDIVFPEPEPIPTSRFPDGQASAPCPADAPPETPTTTPTPDPLPTATPANAVDAEPTFTG